MESWVRARASFFSDKPRYLLSSKKQHLIAQFEISLDCAHMKSSSEISRINYMIYYHHVLRFLFITISNVNQINNNSKIIPLSNVYGRRLRTKRSIQCAQVPSIPLMKTNPTYMMKLMKKKTYEFIANRIIFKMLHVCDTNTRTPPPPIDVNVWIWYDFVFLIVNRLVPTRRLQSWILSLPQQSFNMPARCRYIRWICKQDFFFPLKDHLKSIYRPKSRESKQQQANGFEICRILSVAGTWLYRGSEMIYGSNIHTHAHIWSRERCGWVWVRSPSSE